MYSNFWLHTIAISGGGNNTRWLSAAWLAEKALGYLGDIDSWGFKCLADVKAHQPHVKSLLMGVATLQAHSERIVSEPESALLPPNLTGSEVETFNLLKSGKHDGNRLEQERLSSDYIHRKLKEWCDLG